MDMKQKNDFDLRPDAINVCSVSHFHWKQCSSLNPCAPKSILFVEFGFPKHELRRIGSAISHHAICSSFCPQGLVNGFVQTEHLKIAISSRD
jgi:hypothetical protein